MHLLADAATSVLAILALIGGKFWGAAWLAPVMGIVGAGLVASWACGLIRQTSRVLLDAEMDAPIVEEVREVIASSPIPARSSLDINFLAIIILEGIVYRGCRSRRMGDSNTHLIERINYIARGIQSMD